MAQSDSQTETLSLRISESLRHRLEQIRELVSRRKGESVSTSEIAKQLLESAREDRLEVAELLAQPTESLARIRSKDSTEVRVLCVPLRLSCFRRVELGIPEISTCAL